jgi:hypothetical protein
MIVQRKLNIEINDISENTHLGMDRHLRQANENEDGPCQNEQGANAPSAPFPPV